MHLRVLGGRGDFFNPRKMAERVQALLRQQGSIQKVILCVDTHCNDPDRLRDDVRGTEQEIRAITGVTARSIFVVSAIESWLIADERAMAITLGGGATRFVPPVSSPESECDPKALLDTVFSQPKRSIVRRKDYPKIACRANIERIRQRCPSFAEFCRAIVDP